jgi:outer membrane protein assembly factor BamB
VLVQVERDSGMVVRRVEIGRLNGEVMFDGTYLWASIADLRHPGVMRVHHATGESLTIEVENAPRTPIPALGSVWLTQENSTLLQQIEPASGMIVQSYDLGVNLTTPMFDGTWLWIRTDSGIMQFAPENGTVVRQLSVTSSRPIFREGERVWVFSNGSLYAFSVSTGQQLLRTELPGDYTDPIIVGDDLWLANTREDVILMLRMTTGEILRILPHCDGPTQPLFDGANLWLACRDENAIARIPVLISYYGANALSANPDPYTPVYTEVGDHPYLWIVQRHIGEMVQFDALDGRVLATIPVGDSPLPPIYDGDRFIWVASATGGLVTRVDTQDVRVYAPVRVGIAQITGIELLKGKLWLSGSASDPLTDLGAPDLVMLDPASLQVIQEHEMGVGASRAVYDERYDVVWVSGAAMSGGTAYRLNADTGTILTEERVGYVSYEPVLNGDDAWISSLYPMEASDLFTAVLQANSGALYRLNRETGRVIQTIDLDELPSLPLIAGDYIWVTQGSFELETNPAAQILGGSETGANPRGVVAIDSQSGAEVARWSPCRNVGIPYYDTGGFIWGICIGFEDSEHDESGKIFVIDPETLQMVVEYSGLGRFSWSAQGIDGRIWIVFQESSNVAVFDRSTAALLRVFGVGDGASRLTYDGSQYVWLSNGDDGNVQRIMVHYPP